jgi:hypothetical protein
MPTNAGGDKEMPAVLIAADILFARLRSFASGLFAHSGRLLHFAEKAEFCKFLLTDKYAANYYSLFPMNIHDLHIRVLALKLYLLNCEDFLLLLC